MTDRTLLPGLLVPRAALKWAAAMAIGVLAAAAVTLCVAVTSAILVGRSAASAQPAVYVALPVVLVSSCMVFLMSVAFLSVAVNPAEAKPRQLGAALLYAPLLLWLATAAVVCRGGWWLAGVLVFTGTLATALFAFMRVLSPSGRVVRAAFAVAGLLAAFQLALYGFAS